MAAGSGSRLLWLGSAVWEAIGLRNLHFLDVGEALVKIIPRRPSHGTWATDSEQQRGDAMLGLHVYWFSLIEFDRK